MDYANELQQISDKLSALQTIRVNIEDAITTASGSPGNTFLGFANDIYNINMNDNKTFVVDDTSFKSFNGFSGLQKRAEYLAKCKLYIKNAIIARGVEVDDSVKFSEYPDYIKSISGTSQLPIINLVSSRGEVAGKTMITVNTDKKAGNNSYRYKVTNSLPTLGSVISNWTYWNGKTEISVDDGVSLCIAEVDTSNQVVQAGIVICHSKIRFHLYPELDVITDKGTDLFYTKIKSITNKLNSSNKFYYYLGNITSFYIDDPIPDGFILWDEISEIELNKYTQYSPITIIEVNSDNLIQRFGNTYPVTRNYASKITVNSIIGTKDWSTKIYTTPGLSAGNTYSYILGENEFIENETIDPNNYGYWDGKSEIVLDKNAMSITIIEIDANNKVLRYGYCSVKMKSPSLKTIIIDSNPSNNPYGCIIDVNPIKDNDNKYFYIPMEGFLEKVYNDYIDISKWEYWDGSSETFIKNGTRICMVELDPQNRIIGIGYAYIESNVPIIQNLKMSSEYGTTTGSCHITIKTEKEDDSNIYVYREGNYVYSYDDQLDKSIWKVYDFDTDIVNLPDNTLITIIEVDLSYKAKKIGLVNIKSRPLELFTLTISSWKSQKGGCSNFYITPILTSGNKYKYQFTNEIPELHDDLTDWFDYTDNMDVKSENGVIICFAECDEQNKALKAGLCKVVAKDPDPELGELTIDCVTGTVSGYTKVNIEESLTEGYSYVYKVTSVIPEYNEILVDWLPWDGESEIFITDGVNICIAEVNMDLCAFKAGTAVVYSKK